MWLAALVAVCLTPGRSVLAQSYTWGYRTNAGSTTLSSDPWSVGSGTNDYLLVGVGYNGAAGVGTVSATAATSTTINVGRFYVGVNAYYDPTLSGSQGAAGGGATSTGTLLLGTNNTITASSIILGGSDQDQNTGVAGGNNGSITTAAGGTTTITTPSMVLGNSKGQTGTFTLGTNARLNLGSSGNRATLALGVLYTKNNNESRVVSGVMNLGAAGAVANLQLNSLQVSYNTGGISGNNRDGTLTLSNTAANVLNVSGTGTVVRVGVATGTSAGDFGGGTMTGLLTIGNLSSESIVESTDNATAILVGAKPSGAGASVNGTLDFKAGTLTIKTTGTGIAGGGGNTSRLNLGETANVTLKAGASSSDWIAGLGVAEIKSAGATIDTNGFNLGISQAFSGAGGLSKSGAGTLTLTGTSSFGGAFTVNDGTVSVATLNNASANGPLGNSANAAVLGSSGKAGTLSYTGVTGTSTKAFTAAAGGTAAFAVTDAAATLTLSGAIGGDGDKRFGGAGSTTVGGAISGGNVIKDGAGGLTLAAGNGQSNTTVNAGQLNVNHFAALGTPAGTLTMAAGTLLDNTSGAAVTITNAKSLSFGSSLTFVGSNDLDLGSGIVTLSGSNTEFNVSAKTLTLSGDVVGAGYGITKTGTGRLVLDGLSGSSSFTGNSFVNGGTLVITGPSVLGGGSGTIVTLGASGFLEVDSSTNLGGVTVSGNTQNLISGTTVDANQDFTQNQTLTTVNRQYNGVQTIFSGVTVTTAANYLGSEPAATTPGRIVFEDDARLKATAGFTIDSRQGITLQSGTAVFESDAAAQLLVPASVAGSGGIRKVGAGNLRLTGSNTYQGGTLIEQGIVGISYGESLGDVGGGLTIDGGTIVGAQTIAPAPAVSTVTIDSARTVRIGNGKTNGMHAQTGLTLRYDGVITEIDSEGAAGSLQVGFDGLREGTVILGGANTYRGDTIISHGTLKLGSGGAFGNSPRIIVGDAGSNGAVLDITDKTALTIGAGQTLMGKGTVLSDAGTQLVVAGLFSPGNSPGLFTYDGGFTTLSGTTLLEIWGTSRGVTGGYDAVDVINSGTLSLGGLLQFDFNQTFATDTSFLLISGAAGALTNAFTSFTVTGSNSDYVGLSFTPQGSGIWQTAATGNDQILRLTQTPTTLTLDVIAFAVPEPSSLALLAAAGLSAALLRRRRR